MERLPKDTRLDYKIIFDLIEPESRVLDLGCGNGELLSLLIEHKKCHGTGIEIDENSIYECISKGLTVSHIDINSGLTDYSDKRFDYVIINETIQQVIDPQKTIFEALRIGKKVIVGIPNFCHLFARLQLGFRGKVPVTKELPYEWYNTPNLRFFSIKDFLKLCRKNRIAITKQRGIGIKHEVTFLPNLFAHFGIFVLENQGR